MLVAICDDEKIFRDELKSFLLKYKTNNHLCIDICQFSNGEDLLNSNEIFDIVFLDYQMPGLDGMEVARKLRSKNIICNIVFVTNYPQFVFESFEVQPYRFYVKPLEEKQLISLMNTFIAQQKLLSPIVVINDNEQKTVSAKDIMYLEGDGKYCTIRTATLFNIEYENTVFIDLVVNVAICSLLIIICQTKFGTKIQQLINWIPKSGKRLVLVALIISMILLSLVFDNNYFGDENVWFEFVQKSIILGTILLLVIVGVSVCIMLSNNQLKQLTANYEQQILAQAEHYKRLAESNHELRRFKHDFKNMSIAIEKMLDSEEHKEALQLFQQYNHTLDHSNRFPVMYDTGNGIADALLSDKQQKAFACNCNIVFQGSIPMKYLMPTDICVILGNTLDNAIEACEKFQTKEPLTITVTCNCNSGFMFLSITNPITERVNISNNHIATTKENKTLHGFGLYSLHSVVQKYDGNIELKSTDTTFTANIDLCLAN